MMPQPGSGEIEKDRATLLEVLRRNGFADPEAWVDHALEQQFRDFASMPVAACPDCGETSPGREWGRYVYYSSMMRVVECRRCGLVYSDRRIDPSVLQQHFERSYKDEEYFRRQREPIFRHLTRVIAREAPRNGSVLDVGGAVGHLMASLEESRPDLDITLNDLSASATAQAAERYGFETITGGVEALRDAGRTFDVIVLSDVLYYEPKLGEMWEALDGLLAPGGSIVLRGPNNAGLIRVAGWWRGRKSGPAPARTGMPFYNPEHISILRVPYLRRRLRSIGCRSVEALPSPFLGGSSGPRAWAYTAASLVHRLTFGRVILTSAMLVIGRR